MVRKFAAISLVFLALALVAVAFLRAPMTTTVSVGSGPIALVQNGTVTETVMALNTPVPASLTTPSTAGSTLIAVIASGTPASFIITTPDGWLRRATVLEGLTTELDVFIYANNPGGIQVVNFPITADGSGTRWFTHMSEWSNVTLASLDAFGTGTATTGTTLALSTIQNVPQSGDVALAVWLQKIAVSATVTFTSPTGWTRLRDSQTLNRTEHLDAEYLTNPASGSVLSTTLTSDHTTTSAAGVILVLSANAPVVDQTAYLEYGSVTQKLNTADFNLMLGGRLLLESDTGSDVSGYLLEDGSGVLILDTYIPQLGDPVTFTGPAWTGRVVSVHRESIVEPHSNYRKAGVSATNSAAAPGGIAPGDFSDVAAGGYFVLEDSSGNLQLQDGTGNYLQEGTTFSYRNLTFRQSQNQDGTTTVYGTLETFEGGFLAGQSFLLSNADLGISSQTYTITNVTTTFIGAASTTPVYLIEFGDPYLSLQLAGAGVLTQQGSQASIQQGVFMPGGMLGYAQITANQGTITTEVDVTGLTRTVTVAAGRRIMVSAYGKIASTIGTDTVRLSLYEGLTLLTYDETVPNSTSPTPALKPAIPLQPSAGAHTYNVKAVRAAGTGTVTIFGSTASPAWIMVEDIGT